MTEPTPMPLPFCEDEETSGFWHAAEQGRLVVRACTGCEAVLHLPKPYCHHCGSWDTYWREVSGRGKVYSWTVVHHQVHAAFETPYTVVLVELDDAPEARLVGYLCGMAKVSVGMPMRVHFEPRERGVVVPNWEPA